MTIQVPAAPQDASADTIATARDCGLPHVASKQVSCAYYVCVGFTDRDLLPDWLIDHRLGVGAHWRSSNFNVTSFSRSS